MTSEFSIDARFRDMFHGRLRQVFLYVTDECNASCEYCLYKTTLGHREIRLSVAREMLGIFRGYGAEKVTLIGGEPTLFGAPRSRSSLLDLLSFAKELGYLRTRMDTNGRCFPAVASDALKSVLDDLAVSLDSHVPQVNDALRGKGAFRSAVSAIRFAASRGYGVSVTACIHELNVAAIDEFVRFCAGLGVQEVNLHPLFLMGIERDHFTGQSHLSSSQWPVEYSRLISKRDAGEYPIHVRAPQRFVDSACYQDSPELFDYCPVRMAERILVHPDGTIRVCALTIGSRMRLAEYSRYGIALLSRQDPMSEINQDRTRLHPCMSQTRDFGNLTPLCISFKPGQSEYVWNKEDYDLKEFIPADSPRPEPAAKSSYSS